MKYIIKPTSRFQKDLKRIQKRGYDMSLITNVIKKLGTRLEMQTRMYGIVT